MQKPAWDRKRVRLFSVLEEVAARAGNPPTIQTWDRSWLVLLRVAAVTSNSHVSRKAIPKKTNDNKRKRGVEKGIGTAVCESVTLLCKQVNKGKLWGCEEQRGGESAGVSALRAKVFLSKEDETSAMCLMMEYLLECDCILQIIGETRI